MWAIFKPWLPIPITYSYLFQSVIILVEPEPFLFSTPMFKIKILLKIEFLSVIKELHDLKSVMRTFSLKI
jgi:hypothetical protein